MAAIVGYFSLCCLSHSSFSACVLGLLDYAVDEAAGSVGATKGGTGSLPASVGSLGRPRISLVLDEKRRFEPFKASSRNKASASDSQ